MIKRPGKKWVISSLFLVLILICDAGCLYYVPAPARAQPDVVADFTENISTGVAPLTVQFTDLSTGPVTSWKWDFGDGNSSSLRNPVHRYESSGSYDVALSVSDAHGTMNTVIPTFRRIIILDHPLVTPTVNPYWVKFDQIQHNVTSGDLFFIHGTTNLPAGENLSLNLDTFGNLFRPHMKNEPAFEGITISDIRIQPGASGTNNWSVNMTDFAIQYSPNKYCHGWEQLSPSNPESPTNYRCDPGYSHWMVWGAVEGAFPYSDTPDFYILPSHADVISNVTPPLPPFISETATISTW